MPRLFLRTAVVLCFALVAAPVWLLIWCLASMFLRGIAIIGALIVLQWPVFRLVKRLGWLPPVERDDAANLRESN